uniref:LYR motif containing 1 n=1 Tax=Oncorhynchus mykiss TaxID=8022 RepID=A0A8C7Q470_ONCMY
MTSATRNQVLSLYMRVFRIARGWQSTLPQETESERRYIVQEAQTLFRQNQQLTDHTSIKKCIDECEARIGIGLHYRNPYPRPVSDRHLNQNKCFSFRNYCVISLLSNVMVLFWFFNCSSTCL